LWNAKAAAATATETDVRKETTGSFVPPSELLRRIFTAVEAFTQHKDQHDDIAALVFHYGLLTARKG
jgi:serine phosphatase RsbU (regulator of sigma subunit)